LRAVFSALLEFSNGGFNFKCFGLGHLLFL
jgi:hypothetical protein